jgi:hypothetical protein
VAEIDPAGEDRSGEEDEQAEDDAQDDAHGPSPRPRLRWFQDGLLMAGEESWLVGLIELGCVWIGREESHALR